MAAGDGNGQEKAYLILRREKTLAVGKIWHSAFLLVMENRNESKTERKRDEAFFLQKLDSFLHRLFIDLYM